MSAQKITRSAIPIPVPTLSASLHVAASKEPQSLGVPDELATAAMTQINIRRLNSRIT